MGEWSETDEGNILTQPLYICRELSLLKSKVWIKDTIKEFALWKNEYVRFWARSYKFIYSVILIYFAVVDSVLKERKKKC